MQNDATEGLTWMQSTSTDGAKLRFKEDDGRSRSDARDQVRSSINAEHVNDRSKIHPEMSEANVTFREQEERRKNTDARG